MEVKATSKLLGLESCAGSAWGVPYEGPRKLYRGMILPTQLFAPQHINRVLQQLLQPNNESRKWPTMEP